MTILDDRALRDRLSRGALATATAMSIDAHADALERVLVSCRAAADRPRHRVRRCTIMNTRWHIVTPELPPDCGGVGDYTVQVAEALAESGDAVSLYVPPCGDPASSATAREVVTLDDRFGARVDAQLSARL